MSSALSIKEKNSAVKSFSSNGHPSQTVVREGLGADCLKLHCLSSPHRPERQMFSRNKRHTVSVSGVKFRSVQRVSRSLNFTSVLIKPNQNTKY